MNIAIDVRPALSSATGVGVYLLNLVQALSQLDQENEYHLFSSSWKERFPSKYFGRNFYIHDHHWPVRLLNYSWHHLSRPSIETLLGIPIDVAHSPTPLLIPSRQAHRVTMVHDLYFYFHPEHAVREMQADYSSLLQQHCMKSDAILTDAEYTKQLLVEHLKVPSSKIYSIRLAVDPYYLERVAESDIEKVKVKFGICSPYFLFVGALEPRKNLSILLKAFQDFPGDSSLVLAGPDGWGSQEWKQLLTQRVVQTGYMDQNDLRALYQGAIALVLPSVEEGFGFPVLEAMASEIPVLASRIPIFQEIGGEALLAFESNQVEDLRAAMGKICSDPQLRQDFVTRGKERVKRFSWLETAQKTLDIYRNL